MKDNFKYLLPGLVLLLTLFSFVPSGKVESFSELIISRFNKIWISEPQEKVYLMTDKPYYCAGEKIWLSGFLVNATTHQPTALSRYIYAELRNQADSIISRIKLRRDSAGFAGNIKLRTDLPEGFYTLYGFTYFMQNASPDFFFAKKIYIGTKIVNENNDGSTIKAKKEKRSRDKTPKETDFDLQFFPESGVLLYNTPQKVAFKAIGTDGLSVDVKGMVYTDENEEILSFESENKGMGKIIICPATGRKYYAIVSSPGSQERRFDLPVPQNEGVIMRLTMFKENILYEVTNKTGFPGNSLFLLVHSRGKVLVMSPLASLSGKIPEAALPAGIISFSVIDSAGNTLCERIIFDRTSFHPVTSMECDKKNYGRREPVDLKFSVRSLTGKNCTGNFAISVTDSRLVLQDTLSDNILTYLLLTSDIKGYVEEPASYFTSNRVEDRSKIDLLMLTQGWKRFNTPDIVKGIYSKPDYYLELGQALSGKVVNINRKPSKDCYVFMLASYKNTRRMVRTDSLGHYLIDGIEFPDSTSIILKAPKKKTNADVKIIPDPEFFTKYRKKIPSPVQEAAKAPVEYLAQSSYHVNSEEGMHVVLSEITVEANKILENPTNNYYSGQGDSQLTSKDLEKFPGMNIMTSIAMLPGVNVHGKSICIRGSYCQPLILIDGFEALINDIAHFQNSEIQNIEIFERPNAGIFGARGGKGVVSITLKSGANPFNPERKIVSMAQISPLGYQEPASFYTPKYEVDSIRRSILPDLRSTIYWNPGIKTDSTGIFHVNFYTSDRPENYRVFMEGITDEGELCRYTGMIGRD